VLFSSGLDGQSAYNIVRFLRKLAAAGQAILCTIHQPNALLFEQFDRLLLLERGGRTVYFGPIGKDSQHLVDYFRENGADCPPNANPAEYMLDAIGAGSQKRVGPTDWADLYLESSLFKENKAEIQRLKEQSAAEFKEDTTITSVYATPVSYQLRVVVKRTFLSFWRMPDYGFTR
jgi:ATP-binding cassette subfamily G (WHITE) protein 2 (SNQ2)